jgi:serine/threonine protein kinase
MKRLSTSSINLSAPTVDAQSVSNAESDAPTDATKSFEDASRPNENRIETAADDAGQETAGREIETEPDGPVDPNALPRDTPLHNGAFKIDRVLGRGGLSITYLSHSVASGQKVVIKEFFPPGAQRAPSAIGPDGTAVYNVLPGSYCTGEDYLGACAAFLEKARSVSRVWHPNVVMIYDTFAENNTAYMVMKFLQGNTLQELLEQHTLSEPEAVAYAMHIGQGLEALHKADLIHGDIHPGNVMVCRQSQPTHITHASDAPAAQAAASERVLAGQRVFLIDCGLNRLPSVNMSPSRTRAGSDRPSGSRPGSTRLQTRALREPQPIGAAGYAPLEQYGSNRPVGPQTDVYALGATLYHLLTGQVPVEALDRAQGERLPDPYSLNPRVSRVLSDAVMWALGLQSAERPSTVRAFLERLSHCVGEATATATPQTNESLSSGSREAAVGQPRHAKPRERGNNWYEYSYKSKKRLGLAALLSTTIGLAMWTLWRGSTSEPQPLQPASRPLTVPPAVTVSPEINDKSAEGGRVSNKMARPTVQLNIPQGNTPQVSAPEVNAPQSVGRSAAAAVPTAPETIVPEKANSGPIVDSDASQGGTAKRLGTESELRVGTSGAGTSEATTNRVEANQANINRAVASGEERLPVPVRKFPLQKAQTGNQTLASTLRGRQIPENRDSLPSSNAQSPPRRSSRQQQVAEELSTEPRVPSRVSSPQASPPRVSPRNVPRRNLPQGNLPRQVREKSTSEADLPQLPDTITSDRVRRGTTSEADLPPD